MPITILLAEDDPVQQQMLGLLLEKKMGYRLLHARSGPAALATLEKNTAIQLVIVDYHMPEMNGLELLDICRQRWPSLPAIMLTGNREIEVAVRAMQAGAQDFLTKPPEPERLKVSIENALKVAALQEEVTRLKRKDGGAFTFDQIIGHDKGLSGVVAVARKAASSDIPVLITGKTGTGKEVLARAIHGESRRTGRAFIAVNCGAIPQNLVESTLFGHEKGSFTGATSSAPGKFREASGGTIFLDEVGELPLEAQVKLLRVLQQKEVSAVGSAKNIPVDVRLLSATNRDLKAEVAAGRFREDLYFRLNVLPIEIPPLDARRSDIPDLIRHFLQKHCTSEGLALKGLSADAEKRLQEQAFPGNIRELENLIHRAVIMSESRSIGLDDIEPLLTGPATDGMAGAASGPSAASYILPDGRLKTLDVIEREAIAFAIQRCQNNMTQAAGLLGIAKSTLYRKMQSA